MNYLYWISFLVSLVLSVTVSKILYGILRRSSRAGLYLSLILGVDTEDEGSYPPVVIAIWVSVAALNIILIAIDPILQVVLSAYMVDMVASRLLKVRKQLKAVEKLIGLAKQKCSSHPKIVKAICLEEDGEIALVCPICDPEVAASFGISIGECLDKKDSDGLE